MYRDFKTNNLGVRVYKGYCIVIEKKPGVSGWQECGQPFPLPLLEGFDSLTTIPLRRLPLSASAYERTNPGNELRELLTKTRSRPRRRGSEMMAWRQKHLR